MDRQAKEHLIQRLTTQYGNPHKPYSDAYLQRALHQMVEAGASRLGMRVDRAEQRGFSACDLAPPLARMIDHTALKPETTEEQVRMLCREALQYCFASVCVNPCYIPLVAEQLRGTPVGICTVIGFPLGANQSTTKAHEAELVVHQGATEVDMVLNIGMLKSKNYDYVEKDLRAVVEAARASRSSRERALVKVILETALLTDEEKVVASVLAQNAGADFVKTSTGFSKSGATTADVALMRRVVGNRLGVKASGGVRTLEQAEAMVAHGATRLGASASVAILKGMEGSSDY